jgi:hypothetical protein
MAKKQTRRSISVSRTTYERLKNFCEANNISMSQFVESRVGDFLGEGATVTLSVPVTPSSHPPRPSAPSPARPAPVAHIPPAPPKHDSRPAPSSANVPMTSAAARYAVEPPPPVIKPRQEQPAPKPAEKRPDQIFTF